jgi:hypothetical protein
MISLKKLAYNGHLLINELKKKFNIECAHAQVSNRCILLIHARHKYAAPLTTFCKPKLHLS